MYTLRWCDNMCSTLPQAKGICIHVDTTTLCAACREWSAAQPGIAFVRRDGERREWRDLWDFPGETVVRHIKDLEVGQAREGGRDGSLELVLLEAHVSKRGEIGEGRRDLSGEAIVAEVEALNVVGQKGADLSRNGACECIVCKADGRCHLVGEK